MPWAFLSAAWKIAKFSVPVPVAAFVAAFLWVTFDKHSAVRKAVAEVVAAEQLAEERAKVESQRIAKEFAQNLLNAAVRRAQKLETANRAFALSLAESEDENRKLTDEVAQLESSPVNGACLVDDALLNRMRRK